jgi:hypothetical protein
MSEVVWRRVNTDPFEYAIQQGPHGDEFVKLLDGTCLRRPLPPQDQQKADPARCAECACDDPPSQCDWIKPR